MFALRNGLASGIGFAGVAGWEIILLLLAKTILFGWVGKAFVVGCIGLVCWRIFRPLETFEEYTVEGIFVLLVGLGGKEG
jgi:hypothetical protein